MSLRPSLLGAIAGASLVTIAGAVSAFAPAPHDDVHARKTEMLNTVVQVRTAQGVGSGTVIYSGADGVFILTNHHVMPAPDVPDQSLKALSWLYVDDTGPAYPVTEDVEVIAHDAAKDLTLLRVTDPEWRTRFVAAQLPATDHLEPAEPVFVVGAGLGHRVYVTAGLVSLTYVASDKKDGPAQEMLSAPTTFGNSGGAAFVVRAGRYVLAGVPEAIEDAPGKILPTPMAHMAFATTMPTVRAFLTDKGFGRLIEGGV